MSLFVVGYYIYLYHMGRMVTVCVHRRVRDRQQEKLCTLSSFLLQPPFLSGTPKNISAYNQLFCIEVVICECLGPALAACGAPPPPLAAKSW